VTENLSGVSTFTPEQVKILEVRGISPSDALEHGVMGVQDVADLPEGMPDYWTRELGYLPGLLFRWDSPVTGVTEWQLRPDTAVRSSDGSVRKYVFRKDAPSILNAAGNDADASGTVVITEGTCQTLATAAHLPDGYAVYGIAGCQSWTKRGVPTADLAVVENRTVLIVLDADAATNRNVYDAGVALREACLAEGATSVRFARVPGGKKSGLDDVLGGMAPERREAYLARMFERALSAAKAEKPEAPAATKPKPKKSDTQGDPDAPEQGSAFFGEGGLMVKTLSETVRDQYPSMLTAENKVALYRDGVYGIDGMTFLTVMTELLGEMYRREHTKVVQEFTVGALAASGEILPDHSDDPIVNLPNGMLDLRTGRLRKHKPEYRSAHQLAIPWDPEAKAPLYEAWLAERIPEQADDLEETCAMVLDPSKVPNKALFAFGPSRSGKGTILRLLEQMVGDRNKSGVTLHQLSQNKFMAAPLYGKILNVAGDLSAAHIEDISLFKMMTGNDPIEADRKYGSPFTFTNRAMFAFSANEVPTVGEASRAYIARIKPFHFHRSFIGSEDEAVGKALEAELPGILVRWVVAWQRRHARGKELATDPAVMRRFEVSSDRVRQWVEDCCEVTAVIPGQGTRVTPVTELYAEFKRWAGDEGRTAMARGKFADRLRSIPGVSDERNSAGKRGLSLAVRPRAEWTTGEVGVNTTTIETARPPSEVTEDVETTGDKGVQTSEESGSSGSSQTLLYKNNDVCFKGVRDISVPQYQQWAETARTARDLAESPIDQLFTALHTVGDSTCVDCGSELGLVDGTWFACPSCHPGSARTDQPDEPTTEGTDQ
jgi:putative DNA primase/helicase